MNATTVPSDSVSLQDKLIDYVIGHSGGIISALVVIIVGLLASSWIGKLLDRWLARRAMEQTMRTLLVRILKLFVFAVALVIALGTACGQYFHPIPAAGGAAAEQR